MSSSALPHEPRVALFVDCDNVRPEILSVALRVAAQAGRVMMRRGYGNHDTLAKKWKEQLVREAFTPCLQYACVAGKNTTDIALAVDALEALLDDRADHFVLVTSDSDFAYLCRKLRERGAVVAVVGETKSPVTLRKACDVFHEWACPAPVVVTPAAKAVKIPVAPAAKAVKTPVAPAAKKPATPAAAKQKPDLLVKAVRALGGIDPSSKVDLSALGQHLRKLHPGFTSKKYGHSTLLKMIKTYDVLRHTQDKAGAWTVHVVGGA